MDERVDTEIDLDEDDLRDKYLRTLAENQNLRAAMNKRVDEARTQGENATIVALAPVLDDLKRALDAIRSTKGRLAKKDVTTGLGLVMRRFGDALGDLEVQGFKAEGEAFVAELMEAVATEPTDQLPPGTVTRELTAGLTRHGRLLRPAQVAVAVEQKDED